MRSFRQLENGGGAAVSASTSTANGASTTAPSSSSGNPPAEPNRILKELASKRTKRISKAEYERLTSLLKESIRDKAGSHAASKPIPTEPATAQPRVTPIDVVRKLSGAENRRPAQPAFALSDEPTDGPTAFRLPVRKPQPTKPQANYPEPLDSSQPLNSFIRPGASQQKRPLEADPSFGRPAMGSSTSGQAPAASPFASAVSSSPRMARRSLGGVFAGSVRQQPSFPQPAAAAFPGWGASSTSTGQSAAKRRRVGEGGGERRSDVAQRILETLGKMSTPLEDVRSRRAPSWATPSLALEDKTKSMKRQAFERHAKKGFAVPSASLDLLPKISTSSFATTSQSESKMAISAATSSTTTTASTSTSSSSKPLPKMTGLKQRLSDHSTEERAPQPEKPQMGRPVSSSTSAPILAEPAPAQPSTTALVDPRFMFTPPNAEPMAAGVAEEKFLKVDKVRMGKFSFATGKAPPRQKRRSSVMEETQAGVSFSLSLPAAGKAPGQAGVALGAGSESPRIKPVGLSFSLSSKVEGKKEEEKGKEVGAKKEEKEEKKVEEEKKPSDLFAKFLPPKDTWKCDVCLTTQNPVSADKCLCCEAPRPGSTGAKASAPAPKVDISMFTADAPAKPSGDAAAMPSFSFGAAAQSTDKAADEEKKEAPTFSFGAAGASGGSTGPASTSGFTFGAAPAAKEDATPAAAPTFSFGQASAVAEKEEGEKAKEAEVEAKVEKSDAAPPSSKETAPASGFSFGAGVETSSSSAPKGSTFQFGTSASFTSADTQSAAEKEKPAGQPAFTSTGGDHAKESSTKAVAPTFSFGAAASAATGAGVSTAASSDIAPAKPLFGQSTAQPQAATPTPTTLFGAATAEKKDSAAEEKEQEKPKANDTAATGTFKFGAAAGPTPGPAATTATPFGSTPAAPFKFGEATAQQPVKSEEKDTAVASTPFKFGAASAAPKLEEAKATDSTAAASSGFKFGAAPSESKGPAAAAGAGAAPFQFGAAPGAGSSASASIGKAEKPSSNGLFKFGSTEPAKAAAPAASSQGFKFGSGAPAAVESKSKSSTAGFKFGEPAATPATKNIFGQAQTSTAPASTSLPTSTFAFGSAKNGGDTRRRSDFFSCAINYSYTCACSKPLWRHQQSFQRTAFWRWSRVSIRSYSCCGER